MSRTFAIALLLAAVGGCVDPHSRFNAFGGRVIDASQQSDIDAMPLGEIPDIGGTWLVGLSPNLAPNETFRFIATVTFRPEQTGASVDIAMQPVTVADGTLTGTNVPVNNIAVNSAGEFTAVAAALPDPEPAGTPEDCMPPAPNPVIIPAEADPLGIELNLEVTLKGTIRSKDLFCGKVLGYANNLGCQDLDNPGDTTFAAIPIPKGTTGSALPDPVVACPTGPLPDAGGMDAATPDGGTPDAAATDASPRDAAPQDAPPRD